MRGRCVVKLFPDPDQVFLVLFVQRHAGTDARVDKEQIVGLETQRQVPQKREMPVRHGVLSHAVNLQHPGAPGEVHTVGGQRRIAAKTRVEPV